MIFPKTLGTRVIYSIISLYKMREGGDIGLFITIIVKFYKHYFSFVGSNTLGTFNKFGLVNSFTCNVQTFYPIILHFNFVYNL